MPELLTLLLPFIVMVLMMWLLVVRPQKRRMQEQQEAVGRLQPGSRVLLTSGIIATLTHMGERQAIIELAPGVEATIVKAHIVRAVSDDEEEFEFEDDLADRGAPVVVDQPLDPAAEADPLTENPSEEITFDPRSREN